MIKNSIGSRLDAGNTYALVILRALAPEGYLFSQPDDFYKVWSATQSNETVDLTDEEIAWSRSLKPLINCLEDAGLNEEEIGIATVLTAQDPVASLKAMRDVVTDPNLETRAPENVTINQAWSRRRLSLTG